MSLDRHLLTKFIDINLREIKENKPFLENCKFKKGIFHFYFSNFDISLSISGTLMKILGHKENTMI